ncbi:O-succinylbenzoate synthase [Staphylococcus piscifermentans]|uniref:o-succinylbenzoate synthase n=1 Tax=Staphylococcus piscifermentans TaxID=70258 RepID=A0A239TZ21_9STAP|nr:o-succinylbenzoate synthase [Staphylococcus piscifermentans]RTX86852.1 o-succinylbenzoate synthase [Staphylococcus piscifermentans]GEP84391.1 o-succinylbenzoate synthase [Staphylococcus piscifermentans]SNV02906.1 O-succinylbenzoate synthase [Staphylococcus piscifermentans]
MKFKTINFYTYQAPFKTPIHTPKIEMHARKVLIIEIINQEGNSYFGECNAFETNWYDDETIDTVYHTLKTWFEKEISGKEIADFETAQTALDRLSAQPAARSTAAMALYQVFYKLEAFSVDYGATVSGLSDAQLSVLQDKQPRRVKLKWSESVEEDLEQLSQLSSQPALVLDANESLSTDDVTKLETINNRFNILYIEEPFKDIRDINNIEKETIPPIALDEKASDTDSIVCYIENYKIDTVVLKPFRLGGIDRMLEAIKILQQKNIKVVIGGMYEYGLSRYFTAYLSRLGDYPGDITPYGYYFSEEFTAENGILKEGRIEFMPPKIDKNKLTPYE